MSIPVVGTDDAAAMAQFYGMSVKEMTAANVGYMSGYSGYDIAQTLGLDRVSCDVTWPISIVPDIVGMTTTEADAAITAADLKKGTATSTAGTLDEVLTQDPAAGVETTPDTEIDYSYGDGT